MALNRISYEQSLVISDTYNSALLNGETRQYRLNEKSLKGYSFDDIDNASKVYIANRVYDIDITDIDGLKALRDYADQSTTVQATLQHTFIKEEIFNQLNDNILDQRQQWDLVGKNMIPWEGFQNIEMASSFFEYCMQIKGDVNYWKKVDHRIGFPESLDEDKHKPKSPELTSYKGYILNIVAYLIYALALYFNEVRLGVFIFSIVMDIVLIIVIASDTSTNNWLFHYSANLVLMALGIIFPVKSLYILLAAILENCIFNYLHNRKNKGQ